MNNLGADALSFFLANKAVKIGAKAGAKATQPLSEVRKAAAERIRGPIRETLGVPEVTEKTVEKFGMKAADIREKNAAILQRQELNSQIQDASKELDDKYQAAEKKAKAEDDAAWEAWRDKVGKTEIASDAIVNAIKESRSVMDPEDVAEFRKVLKETKPGEGEAGEVQETRDSIAKNQGAGSYEEASPALKAVIDDIVKRVGLDADEAETVKAVGADRLHVWKTQLEYAVRKATRGNVRYGIGQVLDTVRTTEDQLSTAAGADAELAKARALHGPYKDTFVNPPTVPATTASRSLLETAPEHVKATQQAKRLAQVARYDPSVTELANRITQMRKRAATLPKNAPTKSGLVNAPNAPNIQAENLKFIRSALRRYGKVGGWVLRLVVGGLTVHLAKGTLSALSGDLLIGQAAVTLLTRALRSESMLEWLSKPSAEDMKAINSLPPEDASRLRQALGALAEEEKRTHPEKASVKIAPAMAAFLAGATVRQPTKSLKELRDEANKRKAPATAAAPPGPQSSAQPYTHIFDEERGMIVPA